MTSIQPNAFFPFKRVLPSTIWCLMVETVCPYWDNDTDGGEPAFLCDESHYHMIRPRSLDCWDQLVPPLHNSTIISFDQLPKNCDSHPNSTGPRLNEQGSTRYKHQATSFSNAKFPSSIIIGLILLLTLSAAF
ncbi:hypothetical protein Ciccas_002296 [Cichlidogyrus casuarinus]|uniref:Uncharacterized protein n=1 Tax=Cichlidogyrus casuarinus TaxID=1844966 RepID=A0ABD2QJU5_9PLAT